MLKTCCEASIVLWPTYTALMASFDRLGDVQRKLSYVLIVELKKVGGHPASNICNRLFKLCYERCFIIMIKCKIYVGSICVEMSS